MLLESVLFLLPLVLCLVYSLYWYRKRSRSVPLGMDPIDAEAAAAAAALELAAAIAGNIQLPPAFDNDAPSTEAMHRVHDNDEVMEDAQDTTPPSDATNAAQTNAVSQDPRHPRPADASAPSAEAGAAMNQPQDQNAFLVTLLTTLVNYVTNCPSNMTAVANGAAAAAAKAMNTLGDPPMFCPHDTHPTSKREPRWVRFLPLFELRLPHLPIGVSKVAYLWKCLDAPAREWAESMGITIASTYEEACAVLASGPWDMKDPLDIITRMRTIVFDWAHPAKFILQLDQAFLAITTAVSVADTRAVIVPDWIKIFLVLSLLPYNLREYMKRVPVTRERWSSYAAFKATFENLTPELIRTMCRNGPSVPPVPRTYKHASQAGPSNSNLRPNAKPFTPHNPHVNFKKASPDKSKPTFNHGNSQRALDIKNNACFNCHKPGHKHDTCKAPSTSK